MDQCPATGSRSLQWGSPDHRRSRMAADGTSRRASNPPGQRDCGARRPRATCPRLEFPVPAGSNQGRAGRRYRAIPHRRDLRLPLLCSTLLRPLRMSARREAIRRLGRAWPMPWPFARSGVPSSARAELPSFRFNEASVRARHPRASDAKSPESTRSRLPSRKPVERANGQARGARARAPCRGSMTGFA